MRKIFRLKTSPLTEIIEFRRQLDYKANMRGGQVVVADRFFASSKTCSACGHKLDELPLSARSWTCPRCGAEHDRDVNAASNNPPAKPGAFICEPLKAACRGR